MVCQRSNRLVAEAALDSVGMLPSTVSKQWTRADQPLPRDDGESAASLEIWLSQLCIEMDELTELAKLVTDRAGETVTQARTEWHSATPRASNPGITAVALRASRRKLRHT